jgi:BirA family biotin operon repressor/biotin-[acetyl-CoA-carboxylase] ligase
MIFLPKCHSTNDSAIEMFERGVIGDGALVITNEQVAGRGQRGNAWQTDPGQNLTFSFVIVPNGLRPGQVFLLNILTSLAIKKTCHEIIAHDVKIKWPNDIYVGNKKIGGILIENSIQGNAIMQATVGIGLNVNQKHFPDLLHATSISMLTGQAYDLNQVLNRLVRHLNINFKALQYGQHDRLGKEYVDAIYWKDELHFFRSETVFKGSIQGIDEAGRLIIQTNEGTRKFNLNEISYIN